MSKIDVSGYGALVREKCFRMFTYEELLNRWVRLARMYPANVKLFPLGNSQFEQGMFLARVNGDFYKTNHKARNNYTSHLRACGAHAPEQMGAVSTLYKGEFFASNPEMLDDLQMTYWVLLSADPDAMLLNLWLTDVLDFVNYTLNFQRPPGLGGPEFSNNAARRRTLTGDPRIDFVYATHLGPEAIAVRRAVDVIHHEKKGPSQEPRSSVSEHSAPLGKGPYGFVAERNRKLAAILSIVMQSMGLPLEGFPRDDANAEKLAEGVFNGYPRLDDFPEDGGEPPISLADYVEYKANHRNSAMFEVPLHVIERLPQEQISHAEAFARGSEVVNELLARFTAPINSLGLDPSSEHPLEQAVAKWFLKANEHASKQIMSEHAEQDEPWKHLVPESSHRNEFASPDEIMLLGPHRISQTICVLAEAHRLARARGKRQLAIELHDCVSETASELQVKYEITSSVGHLQKAVQTMGYLSFAMMGGDKTLSLFDFGADVPLPRQGVELQSTVLSVTP